MFKKLNKGFENRKSSFKKQLWMAWIFFPFTILALAFDSVYFLENYFDGRIITNVLVLIYYLLFFRFADGDLRKLFFIMIFLSYLGEIIFCKWFEMYAYRANDIPFYIPFGHAIVYGSGYVFSKTQWAIQHTKSLQKFFIIGFVFLFLGLYFFLNDLFSLFLGALFFIIVRRKRGQNLYFFIAICVIYIELLGTYFQCWTWIPLIWNTFPTVNPPLGAVFIYAGGDVLLAKIANIWSRKKNKQLNLE